jgi:hypothetical protein
MMIVTREKILEYWLKEPKSLAERGLFLMDGPPSFPDLADLTPAEKELLKPVIARHPEYLQYEIDCSPTLQ